LGEPDFGNLDEEGGGEEVKKAKRGRKRSTVTLPLPEVLKKLNGEETVMLLNYLNEMYRGWFEEFDTSNYVKVFDAMFYRYLSMQGAAVLQQAEQQPQEQQSQEQQPQYQEQYQPYPSQPMNPLDNLVMTFVSRVVERIYKEIEDKIVTSPQFKQELENIVRVVATQVAQDIVAKQMAQAPPPESPPPENPPQ